MSAQPVNPPAPPYTIPARSAVWVSRQVDRRDDRWRPHCTRRRLDFDGVFSFHGPELLVFVVEDWLLVIPAAQTIQRRCRVIDALLLEIEHRGEPSLQLIAWPDAYGRSQFARPKRRRDTVLDVQAGQEILHRSEKGERELVVSQVRLYRTNRPLENGQVVPCGRWWLEGAEGA